MILSRWWKSSHTTFVSAIRTSISVSSDWFSWGFWSIINFRDGVIISCFTFVSEFLGWLLFKGLFSISSSSSLFYIACKCWMLRSQICWVFSNELDIFIDRYSLVFLDIDEEFLGMRPNLSSRSGAKIFLNFLPVFTIISKTYIEFVSFERIIWF